MDDMKDFGSWAQSSRYYEYLKVVVDMNYFELWAQGSRFYELPTVVDEIKEVRS